MSAMAVNPADFCDAELARHNVHLGAAADVGEFADVRNVDEALDAVTSFEFVRTAHAVACSRVQPPQVRIGPQSMWTKFEREYLPTPPASQAVAAR